MKTSGCPYRNPGRALRALSLGLALAAATAQTAYAPAAFAQAAMSNEKLEQARKLMEEGQALYAQQKYAEAAQAFSKAYAIQPFAAFLFNEGVSLEKAGETDRALATFRRYLQADPQAPDAEAVKGRIKRIETAKQAGAAQAPEAKAEVMRSLVLVESDPAGAPAAVYERVDATAGAFAAGGENPGWKQVATGVTPLSVTLSPGRFHVLVDKWKAYNRSETTIDVVGGRVHHFKANLSQGAFTGFLRVNVSVDTAIIHIDDPPPFSKPPWGRGAHGEMLPPGEHKVWVEAPGYETFSGKVYLDAGQQKVIDVQLSRVGYGYLIIDANIDVMTLSIDDGPADEVPAGQMPVRVKLDKGRHKVTVGASGKKTWQDEIEVVGGQSREVHVSLLSKHSKATAVGTGVASVLFLTGGTVLGVLSNKRFDELDELRKAGRTTGDDPRAKEGKVFAITADISFGLGALLGALSVYEFARDPFPPSGASVEPPRDFAPDKKGALLRDVRLVPSFSAQSGGLEIGGRF